MTCLWLVSILCLQLVAGENILVIFPNPAKSHFYAYEALFIELAHRGHNVVVIHQFPQKHKIQNYTELALPSVEGMDNIQKDVLDLKQYNPSKLNSNIGIVYLMFGIIPELDVRSLENALKLLNDSYKFDLIMTEIFNTDLFLGFAHKYQAKIVALSSSYLMPWAVGRFAIPDNPSYIPFGLTNSVKMTFRQKLVDSLSMVLLKAVYTFYQNPKMNQIAKKYFGEDVPPLEELAKNTSLILMNTHFSINLPRPLPPQVIEVSGLHIKSAKPLPKDIEKFINESEHGVIYFSFGSLVQSSSMQESALRAFCDVFAELPQRVLWKWETMDMPGKPDNVKIVQWSPQRDVLDHPNVKLFISHGGLLGIIEATHSGVPILGMPFFGDQILNIETLVQLEVAIRLDYLNISKESLSYAVKTLLNEKKYKENAYRLSQIFKDRPQSPLETAVYWTEYVLRHKGAHHLRTAAVNLPWYEYWLLDVISVLLGVGIITTLVLFYIVKLVLRRIFVSNKKQKVQ